MSRGEDARGYLYWISLLVLLYGCWMIANPYYGIWHDARIYLVMGLRHLEPEAFVRDVWFMFGAQDRYSLFDEFYSYVLQVLPVAQAAKLLAALGGFFWMGAVLYFAKGIVSPKKAIYCALILGCVPLCYGMQDGAVLLLVESFANARPFAFASAVLGMAFFVRGYYFRSFWFFLLGLLIHPLLAIWAILACVGVFFSDIALLVFLCVTFLAIGIASIFGVGDFSLMDTTWYDLVKNTSVIVFPKDGESVAWGAHLWWISLLALAGRMRPDKVGRLYDVVSFISAWTFLIAILVSFFFPVIFLAKVQVWRAYWVALCLGVMAGTEVWSIPENPRAKWLWRAVICLSFLSADAGGWVFILLAWFYFSCNRFHGWVNARWQTIECLPLWRWGRMSVWCVLAIVVFLKIFPIQYREVMIGGGKFEIAYVLLAVLIFPVVIACISFSRDVVLMVLSISFAVFSFFVWDQRSLETMRLESFYGVHSGEWLSSGIKKEDVVYWPKIDSGPWFILGAAGYAQSVQGVGIVFSREHASLLYRRERMIKGLGLPKGNGIGENEFDLHASMFHPFSLTRKSVVALCQDNDLDIVVDDVRYSSLPSNMFYLGGGVSGKAWYVFDCREIRKII